MQRASAGKKDDPEKAAKAVNAAIVRLETGVVPSGGGFTKLTPEHYALKEALTALRVKFDKGQTVPDVLLREAMNATPTVEGNTKAEDLEAVEVTRLKIIDKLHSTEVYKTSLKSRQAKSKFSDSFVEFLNS
jgi:hypothetical protein